MKRLLAPTLAALALMGCGDDTIRIDPTKWSCTEWGSVKRSVPLMAGRVVMYRKQTKTECIQWRRVVDDAE